MAEHTRPSKQSEARIDPLAREGIRRFMAGQDVEQLTGFLRACLRAIDRRAAVAIYNEHVLGYPMPGNSDRGRIGAMLRDMLRAGRPDAFECVQNLATQHLEASLDDKQFERFSDAVEELNKAAEAQDTEAIRAAAGQVVEAMRASMDEAGIQRYVQLHALPATLDALLAAAAGEAAPAGQEKPAAKQAAAKKAAAKKTVAKKATAKKATAKKAAAKKAAAKQATAKKTAARK